MKPHFVRKFEEIPEIVVDFVVDVVDTNVDNFVTEAVLDSAFPVLSWKISVSLSGFDSKIMTLWLFSDDFVVEEMVEDKIVVEGLVDKVVVVKANRAVVALVAFESYSRRLVVVSRKISIAGVTTVAGLEGGEGVYLECKISLGDLFI